MKPPTALIILDGIGYSKSKKYNAVAHAQTPHLSAWLKEYPHTLLQAAGIAVGLPEGFMGNSEVGHLTMGAGRIIQQPLSIINKAIKDRTFFNNPTLVNNLDKLHKKDGTLHIMGLLSDAGIHSHEDHLYAFLKAAKTHHITHIVVHLFLDGRDSPPRSAIKYLKKLQTYIDKHPDIQIGSIHGRFYAMDRDKNWDRTDKSFAIFSKQQEIGVAGWEHALKAFYKQGISDEFVPPTPMSSQAIIHSGDGIIFFNFRFDRARQLIERLQSLNPLFIITPVPIDNPPTTDFLFSSPDIQHTLLDELANNHKTVFAIAETEKYAHVTYFFSGGRERALPSETRVLIPSIKTKTYVKHPCMSAPKITATVLTSLKNDPQDFYLINYANGDMVGHSGDFDATVKAVECVDTQLGKLYEQIVEKMEGTMYVTADHGNAEVMYDQKSKQPQTAHTTNPVYFIMVKKGIGKTKLPLAQLADVAPFILKNMGLTVPDEMK